VLLFGVAKTKITPKEMPNKRTKNGGRYSRDDIDWDVAEIFYVQGEMIEQKGKDGVLTRKLPSFSDVARKVKCQTSLVGYYAKRRNWTEKRETFRRMQAKKIAEAVAESRAMLR
jgi:hypothetical protein